LALGFIGAAIAKALVDGGADVLIVDALIAGCGGTYANIAGFADRVSVVEADVRNGAALPALLDGRDVVFNLAGKMSHLDSMEEPAADLQHNCRAQLMLLEACRRLSAAQLGATAPGEISLGEAIQSAMPSFERFTRWAANVWCSTSTRTCSHRSVRVEPSMSPETPLTRTIYDEPASTALSVS